MDVQENTVQFRRVYVSVVNGFVELCNKHLSLNLMGAPLSCFLEWGFRWRFKPTKKSGLGQKSTDVYRRTSGKQGSQAGKVAPI